MEIKTNTKRILAEAEMAKCGYEFIINDKMFDIHKIKKTRFKENYKITLVVKDKDGFILDENFIALAYNLKHAKKIALEFYKDELL